MHWRREAANNDIGKICRDLRKLFTPVSFLLTTIQACLFYADNKADLNFSFLS